MTPPLRPPVKSSVPDSADQPPTVEKLQHAAKVIKRVLGTVNIRKVEPATCVICGQPIQYMVSYYAEGPSMGSKPDNRAVCSWEHVEVVVHQIGEGRQ